MALPSSQPSSPIFKPSPQVDVQPFSVQTGSPWHKLLQASKGRELLSSQVSAPSWTPSPQTVGLQVLGEPSHLKPISNLQMSEHPSPGSRAPSSHCSGKTAMPSP